VLVLMTISGSVLVKVLGCRQQNLQYSIYIERDFLQGISYWIKLNLER
jgi:hypothetical protein